MDESRKANIQSLSPQERKRYQNRVAQRAYRRNQKLRMQALEQALARSGQRELDIDPNATLTASGDDRLHQPQVLLVQGSDSTPDKESTSEDPTLQDLMEAPWMHASIDSLVPTYSRTALHRAISNTNLDMCALLLRKGADINKLSFDGKSALELAVETDSQDLVRLLIRERSDIVYVRNSAGRTALFCAIEKKNDEMARLLLQSNVDVNCADDSGALVLHLAVDMGLESTALLLLEYGADIDA
ncbi:hypothetical protein TrVFT333_004727 [Trichoderma virens FT-333]|nr:hypothetical protein TrVFT333_004727 [Trichoderma virens FT-333]